MAQGFGILLLVRKHCAKVQVGLRSLHLITQVLSELKQLTESIEGILVIASIALYSTDQDQRQGGPIAIRSLLIKRERRLEVIHRLFIVMLQREQTSQLALRPSFVQSHSVLLSQRQCLLVILLRVRVIPAKQKRIAQPDQSARHLILNIVIARQ